jgi:GGDEF domain-containing protein
VPYPEVGASFGLTTFDADEDPDEIMNRADREMYRVKMERLAAAT